MHALKIAVVISAALLAGCATQNKTLDTAGATRLQGQNIALTKRPDFGLYEVTFGRYQKAAWVGMFNSKGVANEMAAAGQELLGNAQGVDPSVEVAQALSSSLAQTRRMKASSTPVTIPANADVAAIAAAGAPVARYVLDVKTVDLASWYMPLQPSKYRVIYAAQAQLIDTQSKETVARAECRRDKGNDGTNAPTREELMANGGARLRQEFSEAAAFCTDKLRTQLFGGSQG